MSDLTKSIGQPVGIALGVLLVGGVAWWLLRDKLAAVGQAVNPASDQNLVNRGVTAVGMAVTGDSGFSVGGWLYDVFGGGNKESARLAIERKPPDERTWLEQFIWRRG